jgi:DNA replication and repair protein RecF
MLVAQGALLQQLQHKPPVYLVDDLPAELDSASRERLLALLVKQQAQIFLTAIDKAQLADEIPEGVPIKMFHVEHGVITAIQQRNPEIMMEFSEVTA